MSDDWMDDPILKEKRVIRTRHLTQHPLAQPNSTASFLGQTKYWVNAQLETVRIKDMDETYLFSTMSWLIKRADEVKFAMELYYASQPGPQGEQAQFDVEQAYDQFLHQNAAEWMKATPLFDRLRRRYNKLTAMKRETIKLPVLIDAQG